MNTNNQEIMINDAKKSLSVDPDTGLVAVQSYTIEAAREEADKAEKLANKSAWFRFKNGPNVLRIFPSTDPQHPAPFWIRFRHWIDLPNGESVRFNCPRGMAGQKCVICEQSDLYKKSDSTKTKGWKMSAQRKALCIAIDRTDPDKGPQIVDLPGKTVYDPLVAMRNNPRAGGDYTDLRFGFDVIITKTGSGEQKTTYTVAADRNNSPLADTVEQMNEWVRSMPDLAPHLVVPTNEEIQAMFNKALNGDSSTNTSSVAPAPAPPNRGCLWQCDGRGHGARCRAHPHRFQRC